MATLGHYSIQVLLHKKGLNSVYSGRSAAKPGKEFAIKVFQPPSFFEGEETKNQAEVFLDSAKVQQKVAAAGARYWAPVYEQGSVPEGSYYVTDRYACSAQELIDGHVRLSAGALHNIVTSVVHALLELQHALCRPHGNLKPSNILISQHHDLSNAEVVLCDPVASRHLDPEVHWAADVRGVAELIYQLVMHSSSPMLDNRQIPPSEQWRALGKSADDWRGFSSRLIIAALQRTRKDLAELAEELAAMEPKVKSPLRRKWFIIAGALIVVVIAGILALLRSWQPRINVEGNKEWIIDLRNRLVNTRVRTSPDVFWDKFDKIHNDVVPSDANGEDEKKAKIEELRAYLGDYGYDANGVWPVWPSLVKVNDAAERFKKAFPDKDGQPTLQALGDLLAYREGVKPPTVTGNDPYNDLPDPNKVKIVNRIVNNIQRIVDIPNGVFDPNLINVRWKSIRDNWNKPEVKEKIPDVNERVAKIEAANIDDISSLVDSLNMDIQKIVLASKGRDEWLQGISPEATGSFGSKSIDDVYKVYFEHVKNTLGDGDLKESLRAEVQAFREDLRDSGKKLQGINRSEHWYDWYEKLEAMPKKIIDPTDTAKMKTWCSDWAKQAPVIAGNLNNVETWFNACYLLDHNSPDSNGLPVRSVFNSGISMLNEFVSDPNSQPEVKTLIDRVKNLKEITSLSRGQLLAMADPNSQHPEAMYAAWLELQKAKTPEWPANETEQKKDNDIRERLMEIALEIKDSDSKQAAKLKKDAEDKIDRQVSSLRKSIDSRAEKISEKASVDPKNVIFVNLVQPLTEDARRTNEAAKLKDIDNVAKDMSDFSAGTDSNWPGNYRTDLLANDPDLQPDRLRNTGVGNWRQIVDQYEVVVPSEKSKCDELLVEIDKLRKQKDTAGKNDPKYEENIREHNTAKETSNNIARVPTVRKNIAGIEEGYRSLQQHLEAIRKYFEGYLQGNSLLTRDAGGRVIFKSAQLSNFYPVYWAQAQMRFVRPTDRNYTPGWPRYIESTVDPTVRFILIDDGSNPFYISLHEITNAQYRKFLTADKRAKYIDGEKAYRLDSGDYLINAYDQEMRLYPALQPIFPGKLESPLAYVTHYGAKTYAEEYLGGSLPTPVQFRHAATLSTRTHIRGKAFKAAVGAWKSDFTKQLSGVVFEMKNEEIVLDKSLDTDHGTGYEESGYAWPMPVKDDENKVLTDLKGNVWEWCANGTIMGGSCMSPLGVDSHNPNDKKQGYCDLGVRVVVTLPADGAETKTR